LKIELNVGILGCGPISQAAHFESVTKAYNVRLYAVCDLAVDLADRMTAMYAPEKTYYDYDDMLADPALDAVVIATSDAFHVPACIQALEAGKAVLCEKPLAVSVEDVLHLKKTVEKTGQYLQVGHMKRFDQGIQSARDFINGDMGDMLALKAWYCDSTHRYAITDAVQPYIIRSANAKKPLTDPKSNLRQYHMLAHGSHLLDTARYLAGEIAAVRARFNSRYGAYCWFAEIEFSNGALGQLDLTVAVRMDWHEGFQVYGEFGSIVAKTFNPWLFKSSEVEIFREKTATTSRLLGADGHFYRRQMEAFADRILNGNDHGAATINDGLSVVQGMVALQQSADAGDWVRLADVRGQV
jgi:predicted dehydrogenase